MIMVTSPRPQRGAFARRRKVGRTEEEARAMMQDFLEVAGARRNPVLGRCGARVHGSQTMRPGGVGAPPGGTMAPCQELADGRRVLAKSLDPAAESAARRRDE